jgi:hypothetical protein
MQLLPHGMQELPRMRGIGLLPAFILLGDSVFIRRENSVWHVL